MKQINLIAKGNETFEFVDGKARSNIKSIEKDISKIKSELKRQKKYKKYIKNNKRSGKIFIEEVNKYGSKEDNKEEGYYKEDNKEVKEVETPLKKVSEDITGDITEIISSNTTNYNSSDMIARNEIVKTQAILKDSFDVVQKQINAYNTEITKIKEELINSCVTRLNMDIEDTKGLPILFYRTQNNNSFTYMINYNVNELSCTYMITLISEKLTVQKIAGDENLEIKFYILDKGGFTYIFNDIVNLDIIKKYHESILVLDGKLCQVTYEDVKYDNSIRNGIEIFDLNEKKLQALEENCNKFCEKKFKELFKSVKYFSAKAK